MRIGITSLADALVGVSVVLTAAIICAGAAGADDKSQQDQFLALLALARKGVEKLVGLQKMAVM